MGSACLSSVISLGSIPFARGVIMSGYFIDNPSLPITLVMERGGVVNTKPNVDGHEFD